MRKRGISQKLAVPLLYRWFWSKNILIKPPLFQNKITQTFIFGASFGIPFFLATLAIEPLYAFLTHIIIVVLCSLIFGRYVANYVHKKAKRLDLKPWEKYGDFRD
jgi:uncharacterized membrane protein